MKLIEETDDRFYIKKSTMPHAGYGLFASVPIKKGSELEIIGVRVKTNSVTDKCTQYADKYKFAANGLENNGKRVVDFTHKIVPLGFAGIINHTDNVNEQNVEIYYRNAPKRNADAGKAVYRFIRNVNKDEEILGNYGEEWMYVMDWAKNKIEDISNMQDDWQTFLSYDLYKLGQLKTEFAYKE